MMIKLYEVLPSKEHLIKPSVHRRGDLYSINTRVEDSKGNKTITFTNLRTRQGLKLKQEQFDEAFSLVTNKSDLISTKESQTLLAEIESAAYEYMLDKAIDEENMELFKKLGRL